MSRRIPSPDHTDSDQTSTITPLSQISWGSIDYRSYRPDTPVSSIDENLLERRRLGANEESESDEDEIIDLGDHHNNEKDEQNNEAAEIQNDENQLHEGHEEHGEEELQFHMEL